jgi:phosphoglycerol transferase MdoB-like AlkP superfamily enzyme
MDKEAIESLKKFGLWFISLFFLEFTFILVMHTKIEIDNIFNIAIYSMLFASFFSIITNIFKEKVNNIITAILLFILGVLFSTQCVFYSIFKIYFSFSNLGLGDQVTSYLDKAISAILSNSFNIILFMLPFILFLIFKKKIKLVKNNKISYIAFAFLFTMFAFIAYYNVESSKGKTNGAYDLYHNVNEVNLNIPKFGVLNSYVLDVYRVLFGFVPKNIDYIDPDSIKEPDEIEEEIEVEPEIVYEPNILELNLSKETSSSSIQKINDYIANDTGTMKNQYTGMFKGYNLIYITAESFSEIGVSEELTPTLYKLTHTGFIFDNYYTPNALSTIGGEFQSLTGLYPDSSILTKWRSGDNYFPYGLATIFRNQGYSTFAYHNNSYAFQDRHKYLVSQGFTNYLGCWNGIEKRMNCRIWPASDDQMMEVTIPDYINSESPFLAYYMTVSGHFAYTNDDNMMSYKHRNEVANLDATSAAKAYVATQIELDRALERLINELTNAGKLDNTVIVLLADHYPYELDLASINSLSSYEREETVTVNHNNLIIWNSKLEDMHIEKPCMSSDVLPTVYNLFGIDYDSRLFTGRDILSDSFGIAIMRNHSWITDKGTYYANGGRFVGNQEELPEGYIDNINTLVNNRLNIAKLIVETNYYNYLFN